MALNKPVTIRFEEKTRRRLENVAASSGLTAADLIRRAVEEWLDRVEASGQITISVRPAPKSNGRQSGG